MTTTTVEGRSHRTSLLAGGVVLLLALVSVLSSPNPPNSGASWRWVTIAAALALCLANVSSAAAAFRRTGPVSLIAFLHLWVFFAFSFPALEMTYRYEQISLGFWQIETDNPILLEAVLLLAAFQLVFFLALGTQVDQVCHRIVHTSRARHPDPRVGLIFLVMLMPLVYSRLVVLRGLGVSGVATSMTTRTDYFTQIETSVSPALWALNAVFPVYAVALGCMAVKFLVPHPTPLGRRLFLGVLIGCVAGVALSGGRAEIVFVSITVALFMYVAGYRTAQQFTPVLALGVLLAALLFIVGQARHGEENLLSQASEGAYVGDDYSPGDITQILGLGRFDAVVMILDRHLDSEALLGSSYITALAAGLDTTFLPRIVAGVTMTTPTVSGEVLGPWLFGGPQNSALPSAPGEAYLNFSHVGVIGAALALGLLTRALVTLADHLKGPRELTLVLFVWTMARLLSDEGSLIAAFAVRNWPVIMMVYLASRIVSVSEQRPSSYPSARR